MGDPKEPTRTTFERLIELVPGAKAPRYAWVRARFLLERLLLRGAQYRLLVVATAIVCFSVGAGALAFYAEGTFSSLGDAVWWAFLRLTDPGYLGDDQGALKRTISTVVTILGYVVFLGALVAIMTQWLTETMNKLAAGHTPLVARDHVVVLGWTNRTVPVVRELFLSEGRYARLLQRMASRGKELRVALLVEDAGPQHYRELAERLGGELSHWDLAIRTGTPLRLEHLHRVDFSRAAAIIVAADDNLPPTEADAHTLKTLMSAATAATAQAGAEARLPPVVAEVFDRQNREILEAAYPGPVEILASDQLTARVMAQNIRHRGLSHVHVELLSYMSGNELYLRHVPEMVGVAVGELDARLPRAVVLGLVRKTDGATRVLLNPAADVVVEAHDQLVVIAEDYDDAGTVGPATASALPPGPAATAARPAMPKTRRVLVLGWSHRAAPLLAELAGYPHERFDVVVLSTTDIAHRKRDLRAVAALGDRVSVRHLEGDYARASDLDDIDPSRFDNVVLLATDRIEADAAADARTLLGLMVLERALVDADRRPEILVELLEPQNAALVHDRDCEVLISPLLVAHGLTLAALRRELVTVLEELLGPTDFELWFRPASDYFVGDGDVTFAALQRMARAAGEVAVGVFFDGPPGALRLQMNPPRDTPFRLTSKDMVVVLLTRPPGDENAAHGEM